MYPFRYHYRYSQRAGEGGAPVKYVAGGVGA
jgi:hypothetical protein